MPDLWMPGAVRDPQPGGVRLERSMPARVTKHITADRLSEQMVQPLFRNVSDYLKEVQYCPHIMLDPFTGYTVQYYPADVGGRALSRWNEDGYVHLQIEIYFSPGVIRNGEQYFTVDQTPCRGLVEFDAWAESWGVPLVWPMGAPSWDSNRSVDVWNTWAGHYGHSQVPGENHIDPGPMPSFRRLTARTPPATAPAAATPAATAPDAEPVRRLLIPQLEGVFEP